jgi:hypothetical protein
MRRALLIVTGSDALSNETLPMGAHPPAEPNGPDDSFVCA